MYCTLHYSQVGVVWCIVTKEEKYQINELWPTKVLLASLLLPLQLSLKFYFCGSLSCAAQCVDKLSSECISVQCKLQIRRWRMQNVFQVKAKQLYECQSLLQVGSPEHYGARKLVKNSCATACNELCAGQTAFTAVKI